MYDGWLAVVAAYGLTGGSLLIWFWMILLKLKRLKAKQGSRWER